MLKDFHGFENFQPDETPLSINQWKYRKPPDTIDNFPFTKYITHRQQMKI
jgi:hypothetical protein